MSKNKNAVKKTKTRSEKDMTDIVNALKAYNAINGTDFYIWSGEDKQIWTMKTIAYTQQEILDAVFICLHECFGWASTRIKRFHDRFEEIYHKIRRLQMADKDDEDEVYYRHNVEESLKAACGQYYEPYEVQYETHLVMPNGETIPLWSEKELKR